MKILFFTLGDATIASSRTRVFQYIPHLQKEGIQTEILQYATGWDYKLLALVPQSVISRWVVWILVKSVFFLHLVFSPIQIARLYLRASRVDVVFIQKVLLPAWVQTRLRQQNPAIVFDFDDALYADDASYSKERFESQLQNSRLVVLENENTEKYATTFGVPSLRVTGPIDCTRYKPRSSGSKSKNEKLIIGWVGSRSSTRYLDTIRKPLSDLSAQYPYMTLLLIGAGPLDLSGVRVTRYAWSLDSEVNLLGQFDIGIMPLEDNEFTRGKGGYKILQYMAMGLPSVASPVGVNSEILTEGETGYLCQTNAQWFEALNRLIQDDQMRQLMGRKARQRAVEKYSYEANTPKLLASLNAVK
jgi:glycosyltransferase involved in cell wall biosynthesis